MLSSKLDLDNSFDLVLMKSIPLLILAPKDFREKLRELLAQLNHYYNEREETAFKEKYENICSMLETAEFDQLTDCDIYQLGYQISSTEQKIKDINRRLTKIEKWVDLFSCDTKTVSKLTSIDTNEDTPSIENKDGSQIKNENSNQIESENSSQTYENAITNSYDKKSNANLIFEILKSYDKSVPLETIIKVTGLEINQIQRAISYIRVKHKVIIIWDRSNKTYLLER